MYANPINFYIKDSEAAQSIYNTLQKSMGSGVPLPEIYPRLCKRLCYIRYNAFATPESSQMPEKILAQYCYSLRMFPHSALALYHRYGNLVTLLYTDAGYTFLRCGHAAASGLRRWLHF